MSAFYSENDPYAAAWLRKLISEGFIAPGVVDERDMREIEAWEIASYTQVHFCAGIGIWSYALRVAGWPDDRPIWTGSFPCQPFSQAGKRKGIEDDRHLWPFGADLVRICKPPVFVGEQVASPDGLAWFDHVSVDLENAGYAVGASDLCAAGVEGYHIRQRLYYVGMADDDDAGSQGRSERRDGAAERLIGPSGLAGGLAYSNSKRCDPAGPTGREQCQRDAEFSGAISKRASPIYVRSDFADWLLCRDAKWRPVEPATFPLVDANSGRVGRLRAYGNALDAETAITFCRAIVEIAGI